MQATAASGESNGKNHNTDEAKSQRLSPSIQETLKGQSVGVRPVKVTPLVGRCGWIHTVCPKGVMKEVIADRSSCPVCPPSLHAGEL